MGSPMRNNVYSVDFKAPFTKKTGGVAAVAQAFSVAETTPSAMKRPSVYKYEVTDPPGVNVNRLRTARGWSQRELAEHSRPPFDHTTIGRLERNEGYTQDTLERVAKALGVQVYEFFLPPQLADWPTLPERVRERLADSVADAAAANRYRKKIS